MLARLRLMQKGYWQ
ncbi:hypothetical protein [Escherichia coli]|nr:hypothetical protein [Escherichia coli]MCZ6218020.1 hypothetical protein [Escherichia coli]